LSSEAFNDPHPSSAEVELSAKLNALIYSRRPAASPAIDRPSPAPISFPPGIYLGLDLDCYLADTSALGSTQLKDLLRGPSVFWWRHLSPDRPSDDTAAKIRGKALHVLVLEGEKAFARAFRAAPSLEDYPNALVSAEDLKRRCRELVLSPSGTKAQMAERIRAKDPDALIWDDIIGTFRAKCVWTTASRRSPPRYTGRLGNPPRRSRRTPTWPPPSTPAASPS